MSEQKPTRSRPEASEAPPGDLTATEARESDEAVRQRLEALRRDPDVRWHMSTHTLELAISALSGEAAEPERERAPGKTRRRRRRKRFL